METKIENLAEFPSKQVNGHEGFVERTLVNLPEKGVTVRLLNVRPGGIGPVPAHSHPDAHFFLVLEGVLRLEVDGHLYEVPSGSSIKVPPYSNHQLRCASEIGMTVLAIKWN